MERDGKHDGPSTVFLITLEVSVKTPTLVQIFVQIVIAPTDF
jgi:hypothetical protein